MDNANYNRNKIFKIKSYLELKQIFSFVSKSKKYNIIRYNKNLQKKFKIDLNDYKSYYKSFVGKIIATIKTNHLPTNKFINMNDLKIEKSYHLREKI